MKQTISLILFLSLFQLTFSQTKRKLRVYTKPSDAIIKLDTMHLEYGKTILLDSGTYEIEA